MFQNSFIIKRRCKKFFWTETEGYYIRMQGNLEKDKGFSINSDIRLAKPHKLPIPFSGILQINCKGLIQCFCNPCFFLIAINFSLLYSMPGYKVICVVTKYTSLACVFERCFITFVSLLRLLCVLRLYVVLKKNE